MIYYSKLFVHKLQQFPSQNHTLQIDQTVHPYEIMLLQIVHHVSNWGSCH